jgi:hypothetical protein
MNAKLYYEDRIDREQQLINKGYEFKTVNELLVDSRGFL